MARTASAVTNTTTGFKFQPCTFGRSRTGITEEPLLINRDTGNPYLEANSQEFKINDMVYLNSGAVTQRLTAGTGPIYGFALTDATNVTASNAQIKIMPVNSKDDYIMTVWSATEASTDRNSVAALVGNMYNLRQVTVTETDTSTAYGTAVDLDTQTLQRVLITGIVETPDLTSSSTYIYVYVRFLPIAYVSGTPTYQGLQADV